MKISEAAWQQFARALGAAAGFADPSRIRAAYAAARAES